MLQKRRYYALDRLDGLLTFHDDMVIYGISDIKEQATADHMQRKRSEDEQEVKAAF